MLWIVVVAPNSGIAELHNVHVVEADTRREAREIAAKRQPTVNLSTCHAEPLGELRDGWSYFS